MCSLPAKRRCHRAFRCEGATDVIGVAGDIAAPSGAFIDLILAASARSEAMGASASS